MMDSKHLLHDYEKNGFSRLDLVANERELTEVSDFIEQRIKLGHPGNIYDGNQKPRALHGYDKSSGLLSSLMGKLAELSKRIIGCQQVYVYQFRVNVKHGASQTGNTYGAWKPHRDYDYWHNLDGLPDAKVVIFHMLVTDHTKNNGPLEVCPGSHRICPVGDELIELPEQGWQAGFSEDIKFQINQQTFNQADSVVITGDAGTLLAMHPLLWHGSSTNNTDQVRVLLSIVFSDLGNIAIGNNRPDFVVQQPNSGVW